jgi:AcrR family transcriptional regulator
MSSLYQAMALGVIGYASGMGRWEPDADGRLREAAMALFEERGYAETTVADIARAAGLTKRTFFRYFADKREVLFAGSDALQAELVAAVEAAPSEAGPFEAAVSGLDALTAFFQDRREFSVRRQRVIDSSPELRERELIKRERLAEAIARALHERGNEEPAASLAAQAAIAIFHVAFMRWVSTEHRETFLEQLREARDTLSTFAPLGPKATRGRSLALEERTSGR